MSTDQRRQLLSSNLSHSSDSTKNRGDVSNRRKTVSGPVFVPDEDPTPPDHMPLSLTSPSAPTSPTATSAVSTTSRTTSHKRTFSGNLFAKLHFLRSPVEESRPPSKEKESQGSDSPKDRKSVDDDHDFPIISPTSPAIATGAMASALKPNKMRERKDSLRKTALLGGKRSRPDGRERKNSLLQRIPATKTQPQKARQDTDSLSTPDGTVGRDSSLLLTSTTASMETSLPSSNSGPGYGDLLARDSNQNDWSDPASVTTGRLALVTAHRSRSNNVGPSVNDLGSPLDAKSPTSQTSYASTTDEDDVLTFHRPTNSHAVASVSALQQPHSSAATSYFPSLSNVVLPRPAGSSHQLHPHPHPSLTPTISSSSLYSPVPEPHSYSETEYWGWVILFTTWVTFTVGMGSCLGLWSWAWDVGEKPYAPYELQDDRTLPIVGYYPALIVLTGVVAWAWIFVAWLGMKYFRHAKIEV